MLDKLEVRIPFSATFRTGFRFIQNELRYAGISSSVKRSQHYQGVIDLIPFGLDAILHAYYRRGARNHKLEILRSGPKSLEQVAAIINSIFDIDIDNLEMMRIDFAADMFGVPVTHVFDSLRVKFKRSTSIRGEMDYELVGGRQLEYLRYGVSPNCVRSYDKPAECKARLPEILKRVSRDAELPTYEDVFGFPESTVMTRIERQAGGGRLPPELATFGQLRNAAEFNPYHNIEILPDIFPFPDPSRHGVATSLKLVGIRQFIERYGYQQARSMLNCDKNVGRILAEYREYLQIAEVLDGLTVETIVESYQKSAQRQISGRVVNAMPRLLEQKIQPKMSSGGRVEQAVLLSS
jgi:hypothetical protein